MIILSHDVSFPIDYKNKHVDRTSVVFRNLVVNSSNIVSAI